MTAVRVQRCRQLRQGGGARLPRGLDVRPDLSSAIGRLALLGRSRLERLLTCPSLKPRIA
jgi:hypothetical protein